MSVMRSYAAFNEEVVKRYEEWLVVQHYRPRTKQFYRRMVRTFAEYLKDKSIASVTHLDVRSYIAHLSEQGATWATSFDNLQVLRRFYDFLHLGGMVSYVAPRLVKMRDAPKKIPRTLSEFEVRQFVAAACTLREIALVEFLYGTGCRVSEVISLRVEHIDFEARTARVSGKDPRGRVVLITQRAGICSSSLYWQAKRGLCFPVRHARTKTLRREVQWTFHRPMERLSRARHKICVHEQIFGKRSPHVLSRSNDRTGGPNEGCQSSEAEERRSFVHQRDPHDSSSYRTPIRFATRDSSYVSPQLCDAPARSRS